MLLFFCEAKVSYTTFHILKGMLLVFIFRLIGVVMSENKGYVHPEVLVDADWVEAHLHDPQVRLLEVDVNTKAYEQGHIPGAVGINWQTELQDQIVRAPLLQDHLEKLLGDAGV